MLRTERPTPILCCGGGTPHKRPILRPDGYVLHEGTECAQFLIAQVSVGRLQPAVAPLSAAIFGAF